MANEQISNEQLDALISKLENYMECWKQFNRYLEMARHKKFQQEDEEQFLEIKCLITQELELILTQIDCRKPTREDVHNLISSTSSLRCLSNAGDDAIRVAENSWHRIYIAWQSILGQMKVKLRETSQPRFRSWFANK